MLLYTCVQLLQSQHPRQVTLNTRPTCCRLLSTLRSMRRCVTSSCQGRSMNSLCAQRSPRSLSRPPVRTWQGGQALAHGRCGGAPGISKQVAQAGTNTMSAGVGRGSCYSSPGQRTATSCCTELAPTPHTRPPLDLIFKRGHLPLYGPSPPRTCSPRPPTRKQEVLGGHHHHPVLSRHTPQLLRHRRLHAVQRQRRAFPAGGSGAKRNNRKVAAEWGTWCENSKQSAVWLITHRGQDF